LGDRPEVLAALVKDAEPYQFGPLLWKLQEQRERAVAVLRRELGQTLQPDWHDAPLDVRWAPPAPALVRQVEGAHGLVAERVALCQPLPLDQLKAVAEGLRPCGYRPIRVRPYPAGKALRVAVVWARDGRDWRLLQGVTAQEMLAQDGAWRQEGLLPVDVAGYV